jgi:hypothetical protein
MLAAVALAAAALLAAVALEAMALLATWCMTVNLSAASAVAVGSAAEVVAGCLVGWGLVIYGANKRRTTILTLEDTV